MSKRFETYAALVRLPLGIHTSAARLRIDTIEELEDGFDEFTEMIRSRGVTRMVRTVKTALIDGNDCIVGIYETRLMDAKSLILPPFYSKIWLCCEDGIWQAVRIHNTTNDARWPMLLTRLAPEPWPSQEI